MFSARESEVIQDPVHISQLVAERIRQLRDQDESDGQPEDLELTMGLYSNVTLGELLRGSHTATATSS